VDHRRTPVGNSLILPLWAIILSALLCVGAATWFVLTIDANDTTTPAASATASATPSPSSATAPEPATEPTPTDPTDAPTEPEPTEVAPTADPVARDIPVAVYNNSRVTGLARTTAGKVQAAGWTVTDTGNWSGSIPETTVYYPDGFKEQAQLLARDLDFGRVMPAAPGMRDSRLTLILTGS